MFAANPTRFPEFVADQILTAQNLSDLFNYLDEQERLTRTNLIGIGIVCGLEVFVSSTGNALTITKGVGITSAGYLVVIPQQTYTFLGDYNAEKDRYYDRFVDLTTKKQRFTLQQLAVAGSPEAKTALTANLLKDKVVLIFVELIENGNKNCDPDSCDDKGITVDVVFRPLLVEETNVGGLIGSIPNNDSFRPGKPCAGWADVRMPRYNVPATTLPDSASILKNFLSLLDEPFIQKIETTLTNAYGTLQLMVAADFNQNPFAGFKARFSFLFDGSIGIRQLIQVQYYYDFMADLLQAYDELRRTCQKNMALCCPDEDLFPRHLLLGAAFDSKTVYRHPFIPSPALGGSYERVGELRFLFARLVQLTRAVEIPAGVLNPKQKRTPITVTPSQLGHVPLSEKAIPYYYDVLQAPSLFNGWNFGKTQHGQGNTNLSYHALSYNNADDHVRFPLKYDLEPYNFFRIEGHIGQAWQTAFREIHQIKQKQRLPFDVVALNGDFRSLIALLQQSVNNLGKILAEQPEKWRQILCYFNDIEMQYDMQAAELRCTLGKVMKFLYGIDPEGNQPGDVLTMPVSQLLRTFDPAYQTQPGSLGAMFDKWYPTVKDKPYMSPLALAQGGAIFTAAAVARVTSPLLLMYYLEKIHEALPAGIVQLTISDLNTRLLDASTVAEELLGNFQPNQGNRNEELERNYILNLNAVIRVCKASVFQELYRNFLFRFYLFMANQSFAMFSFLNSGIQHKAGVPVGGTFVLVYHDALPQRDTINAGNSLTNNTFRAAPTTFGARADASGTQVGGGLTSSKTSRSDQFRDITSIKQTGEYWLAQLLTARTKEDELTDKELLELVDEIPDGVVIADFFLPYVCASECAPMSYIVLPEDKTEPKPTPDPVKLVISGQVTDATTGKPIPGSSVVLKGTSTGTVTGIDGKYSLSVPDTNAVLVFSSVGYETQEITVGNNTTVDAALKPIPIDPVRVVSGQVNDKATGEALVGVSVVVKGTNQGTTTDANAKYRIGNISSATVLVFSFIGYESLEITVGNQTTVNAAMTRTVVAIKCTSLNVWTDAFAKISSSPARTLALFKRAFPAFGDVTGSFAKIGEIVQDSLTQAQQTEKMADFMPPKIINVWLEVLTNTIGSTDQVAFRPLALELFRILTGIIMFYSCVQKDDISKDPVPTEPIWGLITDKYIRSWQNAAANFPQADREVVKKMRDDAQAELARNNANAKPGYNDMLKRLIEILNSLPQ